MTDPEDKKSGSDKQERWKASKSSTEIIRDCLNESFPSPQFIAEFCHDEFEEVHREIKSVDGHGTIVTKLIQYCRMHRCIKRLWERIKIKRINQYEIYYPMWEQAEEESEKTKTAADDFDQYRESESTRVDESPAPGDDKTESMFLDDDRGAINKWFFNDLSPEERSMVLAVALFEGLNRKHIVSISKDIQGELFETT